MFQSLKKWVKNDDMQDRPAPPMGMQMMKGDLQRKFAKGVQYNLKIVIRGERNTGKTCLLHRLKGYKFVEEYIPTAEIQVASIQWDYKATDDVVKVDVWDVVDKGKCKKKESKGLKLTTDENDEDTEGQVLDARFLDVYKNAHAVIMTFDITRRWTFTYIENELPKIPKHLPVLILANFRDMGDHRVITEYEVESLIQHSDRPHGSPSVMFSESSMKNGFGLRFVHKFFNMPFLLVQRESLLKRLETNHLDLESCVEELCTEEHGYDMFMQRRQDGMNKKKVTESPTTSQVPQNPSTNGAVSPAARCQPLTPVTQSVPSSLNIKQSEKSSNKENSSPSGKAGLFSPSQMEEHTTAPSRTEPEKKGFMSRFFRRSSSSTEATNTVVQQATRNSENNIATSKPVSNVEEFIPDDDSVDDFLNEISNVKHSAHSNAIESSDGDDDQYDGGNPMVAGFQEDLDSDDQVTPAYKQTDYSSSDSESKTFKTMVKPRENNAKKAASNFKHNISEKSLSVVEQNFSDSDQDDDLSSDGYGYDDSTVKEVETIPEYNSETIKNDSATSNRNMPKNFNFNRTNVEDDVHKYSESEDDMKKNAMVSTGYDDISSQDEASQATPQRPPVAIVTPLQAERKISSGDEELMPEVKTGLNLELDSADLDFLERTTKRLSSSASEEKKSSKESRSHKSKKSSSKKGEENETSKKSHRKHKKHRSKDIDETEKYSKSGQVGSHRTKEDKDSKKKRRSRKTEESEQNKNVDNDLEAFLSTM